MELDGGVRAERAAYDARRDAYFRRQGLQAPRFWNAEVSGAEDEVSWKILSACRKSDPSRRGGHVPRGRRPQGRR